MTPAKSRKRATRAFFPSLSRSQGATYTIATLAGPIVPVVKPGGVVTVDMGEPELRGPEVPTTLAADAETGRVLDAPLELNGQSWAVTCVSMGNPHAVVFVDDLEKLDFDTVGPLFEVDPAFPAKTNTEFVQVLSPTHLKMKVWERGAGPTLACGTGVAARRRGRQPSPGLSASRHSGHRRRPSRLPPCRPAAPAASPPRHLATFARRRVCADRGRGARGQGGEDVHGHAAGRRPADRVARERQPHLHDRPGRAHLPRRV